MKKGIHPKNYRTVIFRDTAENVRFLIDAAVDTDGVDTWTDGKEYPVKDITVSSASHPFYTGTAKVLDVAGRVEKFKARVAAAAAKK